MMTRTTTQGRALQNSKCRRTTFSDPRLEQAFVAYCQLVSPLPWAPAERESKRRELLSKAERYVHLPQFDAPDAEGAICQGELLEPLGIEPATVSGVASVEPRSAAAHPSTERSAAARSAAAPESPLVKLCVQRVMTVAEERSVMKRLHYLKFLAARILSAEEIDDWDLARANALVSAALWHRDLVVRANMRLVVSIVKKLSVPATRQDELISDGAVALLRALDSFDPSLGYRFCTYASLVVRRECFRELEQAKIQQRRHAEVDDLATAAVARDQREGRLDRSHWLAWRKRLPGLMGSLTRREQMIIRSRFCLGAHRRVKTLKRLAAALKISKERVRQIERSALAKLRRAAEAQA